MKCKRCGAKMPDAKKTCSKCGAYLEGYTLNNVTGEYGYRGADGNFYKSEEDYRRHSSAVVPSATDQMKLRDVTTVPELPDPMEAMMKQTIDGLHNKEMAVIEDILRHHIDYPIEGELTSEKVRAAGIRGVMYSDEFPQSRIDDDGNDVVCGIYCIAGYVCALLFMPSLKVAMFIWGLCCAIDNIGWLVVYHRNKDKFTED